MYLPKKKIQEINKQRPDCIPVVVVADKNFRHVWKSPKGDSSEVRILVPKSATLTDLRIYILRLLKQNNSSVTDALFIASTINKKIINTISGTPVSDIVDIHGYDGVLYLTLYTENAFG